MMLIRPLSLFIATLMLAAVILLAPPRAQATDGLNETQRNEVEELIRTYLRENPEVLVEAIQALRNKQEMAQRDQAQAAVTSFKAHLAGGLNAPSVGPVDAPVTVVEFFDYRCGYCKRALPVLKTLIETNDDIRFVFMEFPILGDDSLQASRAALAVWQNWPERYMDVHDALMGSRGALSLDKIIDLIAEVGIDADAVRQAMMSADIDKMIQDNRNLAESMGINGTPAFIIGDELVPGAIGLEDMKQLIDVARNG